MAVYEFGEFWIDSEDVVDSYLETALWSSTYVDPANGYDSEDGRVDLPLDEFATVSDLSDGVRKAAAEDVEALLETMEGDVDLNRHMSHYLTTMNNSSRFGFGLAALVGHDFWLTRNGHGAGAWDRGAGESGEEVSKMMRSYGDACLWLELDEDDEVIDSYFAL